MSEVRVPRKPISFFLLPLGVGPSKSIALYLPVAHDETSKQISICNDNYKFIAFPRSIFQKFTVNEVTSISL